MGKIPRTLITFAYGLTVWICICTDAVSQTTHLFCKFSDESKSTKSSFIPDEKQQDSAAAVISLNKMLAHFYDAGHLAATIDSLRGKRDSLTAYITTGPVYRWKEIRSGSLDEGMLAEAGFRDRFFRNRPLSPGSMSQWNRRILSYCEDNGYPFARLRYDSIVFEGDYVTAELILEPENKITIDSIIVKGNSKLTMPYLYSYLSIHPGDLYNENLIRKIPARIKELPMVTELRPFQVAFTEETARVILYNDNKKASQFDGIIGIQPDYNNTGKVQVTGDLRLRLLSSFGHGELFDLNWRQPAPQTQDLKVKINYPFIFSTPFGVEGELAIFKKDTSYLEVVLGAGVQFLLSGGSYLKALVRSKKSTLLSTEAYENSTELPPFADVEVISYGLSYKAIKLDYRFNPRSGYSLECGATAGNKTITKNGNLNPEVYDSLDLKTVQYNGNVQLDWYFPVFRRNVLLAGISMAGIAGEDLFDNELIRFGGLRTLRGFDEESMLASALAIGTLEFRYLLEQNSNLFIFVNGAWYERNTRKEYISDTPVGFGGGITFETKLGIFSISYALGSEFGNPIQFKSAKIHFGLVNYF